MKILIIVSAICYIVGYCAVANNSILQKDSNSADDSSFVNSKYMSAAWYNIINPEPKKLVIEDGGYAFWKEMPPMGITLTFPQESAPAGDIKLIAVPYDLINITKIRNVRDMNGLQVYLLNSSNDTLYLRPQDMSLIMIQEAMDQNGDWKPIEYWQNSWCGNSYMFSVNVPPNNYISVNAPRYKGTFETQLRFKFKTNRNLHGASDVIYSNSFSGSVNLSQFDKPVDGRMINYLD